MASIAATIASDWRRAVRKHNHWSDCEFMGHEPFEAHGDPVMDDFFNLSGKSEWIEPEGEDMELLATTQATVCWYTDGSILLHSDDAVWDEHWDVLRGRKREVAMRLAGWDPACPPTMTRKECHQAVIDMGGVPMEL